MGRGVIAVCGNIHVSTGACQSAVICIATSWTEELKVAVQPFTNQTVTIKT